MKLDVERLKILAADGLSAADAAAQLGVSRQRVYQVAARDGIKFHWRAGRFGRTPGRPKSRAITGGVEAAALAPGTAGRIGELLVAADLMARGWKVYFPLDGRGPHDLIVAGGSLVLTVEVRSARRDDTGAVRFTRGHRDSSAHYALVVRGEPVVYQPDLPPL